ncbi:hypothetical protein [Helicobacter sp. MIT 05-5294]|uniref:hypothetical protein n=1 Tax=Helicobacter sp. MIT 05-5294 TaxID=1548150 RepID=UPI000B0FC688|nr:hypothetical protein [Helicobacter sp. MIT 05-5294]
MSKAIKISKIGILTLCAIISNGCYQNSCGISSSYWDEKTYYYDGQGNYREKCPDNIIYKEKALQQQEQDALESF